MKKLMDAIRLPGWERVLKMKPGEAAAVTGCNPAVAAAAAGLAGNAGKRVLLVADSDLRATRAADDLRQLTGAEVALLPGGEIDLTRAAGSLESSWRRLEALTAVTDGGARFLCTSVEALMQRMGRPEPFRRLIFSLRPGDRMPPREMVMRLTHMGYERVSMVEGKGQFALRGAILDFYPPAGREGVRVEFFDDEIDSLRTFDCISQRSLERLDGVRVTPACEALLSPEEYAGAALRMRSAIGQEEGREEDALLFEELPPLPEDEEDGEAAAEAPSGGRGASAALPREEGELGRRRERLLEDAETLAQGLPFRRIRAWISVLTEHSAGVWDWFDPELVILWEPDRQRSRTEERQKGFAEDLLSAVARGEASPAQEGLLMSWEEVLAGLRPRPMAALSELLLSLGGIRPDLTVNLGASGLQGYQGQLRLLKNDMVSWRSRGWRVILLSGGEARGRRLCESLSELDEQAQLWQSGSTMPPEGVAAVVPLTISQGFLLPESGLALVSDADIWGEGYRKSRSRRSSGERISTFTDLKVGDFVVHEDHGVGVYKGITRLQSEGTWRDYLLIQYQGNDRLYVPVEQLERVQRYIGNPNQPPKLNALGGGEWSRQKGKVREHLRTLAFDLRKLYAERSQRTGFAFSPETPWQKEFEDEFPWELTPDQAQSVREITADMESDRNMDRLLCGDVGYGKTEVSLRAAFKAIMDNKQVALLAPTTILVQQHYNTVVKRFHHTGARVESISRFRTPKEQKEILRDLAEGKIDFIIGTHRLLAKDVKFRDLGLLIVDEEQRFGVAHKEAIKNLKKQVDVLTLSATPIPRTLHMSMAGIRDMSVLETPPEERIPVQTTVTEYSDALVRDAILRELGRGGQVYFLYNRVRSIEAFYGRLRALVPEARIGVAHGQMKEHGLEDVMMDFYAGSYDVLLCTTIIESGLDVPSANTLIVFDAERFGLSQLYQLRGRVGRSSRQAYAYFTVRADHLLSETAQQRLEAIREFTEFGSGFRIAMRDLEIRGAGNILGPEQHGHLETVGYDMYCKLIEETLAEVGQGVPRRELETRVNLRVDAYLPEDYVSDEKQRMEMYKRIASVLTEEDRTGVTEELIDRYGDPPQVVTTLLDVSQLRALCNRLGVSQVSRGRISAPPRLTRPAPAGFRTPRAPAPAPKEGAIMRLDERYVPDPALLLRAMTETDEKLALSGGTGTALTWESRVSTDGALLRELLGVIRRLCARLDALEAQAKQEIEAAGKNKKE